MVAVARKDLDCALCGQSKSGRTGEHVLPRWFVSSLFGRPPFTSWRAGKQVKWRGGKPREDETYPWVTLPCCKTCNQTLEERFESPLRPSVELAVPGVAALTARCASSPRISLREGALPSTPADTCTAFSKLAADHPGVGRYTGIGANTPYGPRPLASIKRATSPSRGP